MLKALALTTLTALPLGPQSTTKEPILIRADLTTPMEFVSEIMLLVQLNNATEQRQRLLDEQLEIYKKIRHAKRQLKEVERATKLAVDDLASRLQEAREDLANAKDPEMMGYAAAHSGRKKYARLQANWKALTTETKEARENRSRTLGDAEDLIAELEWDLKSKENSAKQEEERARLEARIKRFGADMETARAGRSVLAGGPVNSHSVISEDFKAARIAAAVAGRPLLVNFTSFASNNARRMEVQTFANEAIATELADYVEARLHSDAQDRELRADIAERAKTFRTTGAAPVYVVLDPRSGAVLGRHEGSTRNPAAFAEFLAISKAAMGGPQPEATSEELWARIFDLEDEVARLTVDLQGVNSTKR